LRPLLQTSSARWLLIGALFAGGVAQAQIRAHAVNLHNPVFADRAADAAPRSGEHYIVAPTPKRLVGFVGDVVSIPFAVTVAAAAEARVSARLLDGDAEVARVGSDRTRDLRVLRALDVNVEGNSNASCSCPAGQLPQQQGRTQTCVPASSATEAATPRECPSSAEREQLAATFVRPAPFVVKDALVPLPAGGNVRLQPDLTELLVVEVPIHADLPRRSLTVQFGIRADNGSATATATISVLPIRLERFPAMDLSYWLSEDPRDLVARPDGAPLNGRWGPAWWSDDHWRLIERAAQHLARMGTTNTLVPLFVRSLWTLDGRALVPTRCITGSRSVPQGAADSEVSDWRFAFDFTDFQRWIRSFRQAGFRRFEGAHLFANGGELPQVLECDLYTSAGDTRPYASTFRFLPRPGSGESKGNARREAIYRDAFLPQFLDQLAAALKEAGLEKDWLQHVIDENASDKEAMRAYADGVKIVRRHLPSAQTIDAINKYSAPEYVGLTDVPVFHLVLLYDDQLDRKGLASQLREKFRGRKYFYNTAFRRGGPNRFLDTNPMDSRATGWLALELEFDGFLYWASNQYRYPAAKDLASIGRPSNWSPFVYAQGPRPGGIVAPAYGAGGNWILYPTAEGLIDSLRARRLRDGLLDHWIYQQAWTKCKRAADSDCTNRLTSLRTQVTGRPQTIADVARNPAEYDRARDEMLRLLER
jgi:hypothetical protein